MKNIKKNNEKGITLIALVITIIVLIILAGVAIAMLSGENGILRQAADAKVEHEAKSEIEQVKLAAMAAITNEKHKIENEQALNNELAEYGLSGATYNDEEGVYELTVGENFYNINSNGEATKIITFYINDTECKAEDGMTWEEWCESDYQDYDHFVLFSGDKVIFHDGGIYQDELNNQIKTDTIINGERYTVTRTTPEVG